MKNRGEGDDRLRAQRWLSSYSSYQRWLTKLYAKLDVPDLETLVARNNGIVRVEDVLPDHVAMEALRVVQAVPDRYWNDTSAGEDHRRNNIRHSFQSTKAAPGCDVLLRLFQSMRPDELSSFSVGKYCRADGIAPHDDKQYTQVAIEGSKEKVVTCSRTMAVVYYLTKGWSAQMGGELVDLETGVRVPVGSDFHTYYTVSWHFFLIKLWHINCIFLPLLWD
jgi:hypothetical protein